jgi:hypothetical protein
LYSKTDDTEAIVLSFQEYKREIQARMKSLDGENIEFIRIPKRLFMENWTWYCSHHEASGNCKSEDEALFMGGAHLYYSPNEELCDLYLSDELS